MRRQPPCLFNGRRLLVGVTLLTQAGLIWSSPRLYPGGLVVATLAGILGVLALAGTARPQ